MNTLAIIILRIKVFSMQYVGKVKISILKTYRSQLGSQDWPPLFIFTESLHCPLQHVPRWHGLNWSQGALQSCALNPPSRKWQRSSPQIYGRIRIASRLIRASIRYKEWSICVVGQGPTHLVKRNAKNSKLEWSSFSPSALLNEQSCAIVLVKHDYSGLAGQTCRRGELRS